MSIDTVRGVALPAEAPEAPPRPWRYATLVLACPECGARPGASCEARGRLRPSFHLARYAMARELAGLPLSRTAV